MSTQNWSQSMGFRGLVLAVALISVTVIADKLRLRFDLTDEGRFTLSDSTIEFLGNLAQEIRINFYYSKSAEGVPHGMKAHVSLVRDFLREFEAATAGKITLREVDPQPDTDEDLEARRSGVNAVKLPTGGEFFFGISLLSGSREASLPFFDPRRAQFLEYDLLEATVRVIRGKKVKVALASDLPLSGDTAGLPMRGYGQDRKWAFVRELERMFELEVIKLSALGESSLSEYDAVVVVHPKKVELSALYALDQYFMSGKPLALFVDPFLRKELSLPQEEGANPWSGDNTFSSFWVGSEKSEKDSVVRLLKAWGVNAATTQVVGDLKQPTRINMGGEQIDYPAILSLGEVSFSKESPMTAQLQAMVLSEATALTFTEKEGLTWTPLLQTSDAGRLGPARDALFSPNLLQNNLSREESVRTLAAFVSGQFESAFPDGKPGLPNNSQGEEESERSDDDGESQAHKSKQKSTGNLIVVGDVDLLTDDHSVRSFRLGSQVLMQPINNNLSFAVNMVETLAGLTELLSVRSRGEFSRPFTRLQEIRKQAQEKYQKEEEKLSQELSELQKKLNEMEGARIEGNRLVLSDQQQAEIERFREREIEIRKARREVRKKLREDIEALGKKLTWLNVSVMPLLVGCFGFLFFWRRSRLPKVKLVKHQDEEGKA